MQVVQQMNFFVWNDLMLEKFDWFADFVTSIDFLQLVRKQNNNFLFFILMKMFVVFLVFCTFTA